MPANNSARFITLESIFDPLLIRMRACECARCCAASQPLDFANQRSGLIKDRCWQEYGDCCHCCHEPVIRKCNMNARTMNKIEFVYRIARFGFLLALGVLALTALFATAAPVKTDARSNPNAVGTDTTSLKPPDKGQIPVAFLISDGAVVIDFCGPWEVFQDVMVPGRQDMPFHLYTVAETKKPIRTSGGMQIVPDYTMQNAPPPKVIVIPA